MKRCSHCLQYHDTSCLLPSKQHCFTYQNFSKIMESSMKKRTKTQQKMSQTPHQSRPSRNHTAYPLYPSSKHYRLQSLSKPNSIVKSVRRSKQPTFFKYTKIETVASENNQSVFQHCKTCTKRHRQCYRTAQTCADEKKRERKGKQVSNFNQDRWQPEEESTITDIRVFLPVQTPFKKPYSSKAMLENPVVYDTLKDNRICGCQLVEEGEIQVRAQDYRNLLEKMKVLK